MFAKLHNGRALFLGGLLLALAVAASGCATAYVEPGPNPARVEVDLRAVTNDAEIDRAGRAFGLPGYLVISGVWRELKGPFWSWGLYLVMDDGSLRDLKPLSGGPEPFIEGYSMQQKVTFLVPAGARRIRLLAYSHMEFWTSSLQDGNSYEIINVSSYSEDFYVDLKGGQLRSIKRSFGTPGKTGAIRRTY